MQTQWKISADGKLASRTLDDGSFESHLIEAIDADELATALPADHVDQAHIVRAQRDAKIAAVDWRYTRHAREVRLGLTPTDDIAALDTYVQALADISKQSGFPDAVDWPLEM